MSRQLIEDALRFLKGDTLNEAEVTRYRPDDFEVRIVAVVRNEGDGDRVRQGPASCVIEGGEIREVHRLRTVLQGTGDTQSRGIHATVYYEDDIEQVNVKDTYVEIVVSGQDEQYQLSHQEANDVYGRNQRPTT